jgi:hypothetical protein
MRHFFQWSMLMIVATVCQPISSSSTANTSPSPITPQVISPNAYKVPYLGYDGIFHLNSESKSSSEDIRNPKRIDIKKMEEVTFYDDTEGNKAIARDCHYVYLGALPDSKYYAEFKSAVWDVFELEQDESTDPACTKFTYLIFTSPHGDPIHMHFRYGDDKSSIQALVDMSKDPEDESNFNPWWSTYCGDGNTACGKDE